jgi:hypothetical protein
MHHDSAAVAAVIASIVGKVVVDISEVVVMDVNETGRIASTLLPWI